MRQVELLRQAFHLAQFIPVDRFNRDSAIVSQFVVLLKDTALGTIIAYDNLTSKVSILQNLYTNAIPAAIVIACVYIPINLALAWAATRLERRNRRRRISATGQLALVGGIQDFHGASAK